MESLALFQRQGNKGGIVCCLFEFASAAAAQQQLERAARLFGAAEALKEVLSINLGSSRCADYERALVSVRAQLNEATFDVAWAAGQTLTLEQAIVEALGSADDRRPAAGSAPSDATR